MRILTIYPRPPFPPEGRETVRPYHQLRFLALHHDLDVISFSAEGVDEWAARERLRNLCHRVQIVPLETPPQSPGSMRHLLSTKPLALRRYFTKDLLRRLAAIGESDRYDLVLVYSAAMAPYLEAFPAIPKVLDLVDVGSLRWLEYANLSRFPASTVYKSEATRLLQTETRAAQHAQRILFAAEQEAEAFRALVPGNDRILTVKTPVNPRARMKGPWAADPTILFTGHLDHFPNADAAVRLLAEVFPRVRRLCRRARLVIAGKNPPDEVRTLAEQEGVSLVGERKGLRRRFRDAWVAVAPQRVAHGVRNEILEALAAGVPVVATQAAASGLDLLPGRDLVVAESYPRLAAELARLLHEPAELDELGERGRKAVHNNYSHWGVALRLEEAICQAAVEPLPAR